jgi:hypothetical protein
MPGIFLAGSGCGHGGSRDIGGMVLPTQLGRTAMSNQSQGNRKQEAQQEQASRGSGQSQQGDNQRSSRSGNQSGNQSGSRTRGGTSEQHAQAGRQSHKNDR